MGKYLFFFGDPAINSAGPSLGEPSKNTYILIEGGGGQNPYPLRKSSYFVVGKMIGIFWNFFLKTNICIHEEKKKENIFSL